MLVPRETPITAADHTFIKLRQAITEGDIQSGSKLSETELAKCFGVSRAIIREAINRLGSCHLIERKANVGARVISLTAQGLMELYQTREALEGMAARLAAQYMNAAEVADLQALLNSHSDKIASRDCYFQDAGDVDFHYRIVLGSKNQQLITLLVDGIYHLVRMYRVQYAMTGPRITTAFAEHQHIVTAIANQDGELAELLMRRHIEYSRRNIATKLTENSA